MSERDEHSVSNRSLLIKANVEEIVSPTARTALIEYQHIYSLLEHLLLIKQRQAT